MTPTEQQIGRSPAIDFRIGQVSVKPVLDDIRNLRADVLVDSARTSAAGTPLGMSEWVRAADTDGAIGKALSRQIPLRLGNIVVTDAGALKAKYILHASVLDWKQDNSGEVTVDQKIVSSVARRCVRLAAALGVRSMGFTPWGTSVGAIEAAQVTALMMQAITQEVKSHPGDLEVIYLISNEPKHYRWFVDRAFVFQVVRDQLDQVYETIATLDIPDLAREKILSALQNAQRNVVVYNEIYGGAKYDVSIDTGKGVVVGDQASASLSEPSAKP
jgi:O-acetyl-ADP-ribose deacetylase (regulator of RNase III)